MIPKPVSAECCPSVTPGFQIEALADGMLVTSTDKVTRHYLNQTAAVVYAMCDGATSADQIAQQLCDYFDLSAPPHAEVTKALRDLAARGVIYVPDPDPSEGG